MLNSKKLWCKYHSNMFVLTTSSVLQTFPNWRDSSIWKSYFSKTTIFIVSSKSQNLKLFKLWTRCQLKTTKFQTRSSFEHSLCTDSQMLQKLMVKLFLTLISIKLANNFSILIKYFLLQRSFLQKSKINPMGMKAKRRGKIKLKTIGSRLKRMLPLRRVWLEIWLSLPSIKIKKLIS